MTTSVQKSGLNQYAQPFLPESVPFELKREGDVQCSTVAPINFNNGVNDLVKNDSGPRRSARLKQKQADRQATSTASHTNMQPNGAMSADNVDVPLIPPATEPMPTPPDQATGLDNDVDITSIPVTGENALASDQVITSHVDMNESDIQRSDTTTSSTPDPRGQDLRNVTDQEVTSRLLRNIITDPVMMEQDYLQDFEFCDMYNYLRYEDMIN